MSDSTWNRRDVLCAAGAAGLVGTVPAFAAGEPPPETTRLRLADSSALCLAPQFVIDDLLRAEGFSQVEFVQRTPRVT